MGRAAVITKQRVLDTAKLGLERTNDCIRDVATLQKKHNDFVRAVETKIDEVRTIASSASAWSEANETQLSNVRKHLDARIASVDRNVLAFQTMTLVERVWWLLTGRWPLENSVQ